MVAALATHHDTRGALIDVSLGESPDPTTSRACHDRSGDIESQHFSEGACCGVTVEVRRFCHLSFFLN
jgi:hypothetical protein